MPYIQEEEDDIRDVTRRNNRALRKVNRLLRRKQERTQAEFDATVAALFDAPSAAEDALAEIHSRLELDCDPLDYVSIVRLIT